MQPSKRSKKLQVVGTARSDSHIVRYERLKQGAFFADFRRDKRLYPEVYHCIIQREGEAEIIAWTQHVSLDAALAIAREQLQKLCGSDSLSGTGAVKARAAK